MWQLCVFDLFIIWGYCYRVNKPIESYIIPESQSIKYPNFEVFTYIATIVLLVGAAVAASLWAK